MARYLKNLGKIDDHSVGQSTSEYTRTQAEGTESLWEGTSLTKLRTLIMHIKINYTNGLKIYESKQNTESLWWIDYLVKSGKTYIESI